MAVLNKFPARHSTLLRLERHEFFDVFNIQGLIDFSHSPTRDRYNVEQNIRLVNFAVELMSHMLWRSYYQRMNTWVLEVRANPRLFEAFSFEQLCQSEHIVRPQIESDAIIELPILNNRGLFRCKKCGTNNTVYTSVQTRSADEGMTVFIRCLDCNESWRR